MTCELCQRFSPRYNTTLRCCQVRAISVLPYERRRAAYAKVLAEDGEEALQQLKNEVLAEYRRKISAQTGAQQPGSAKE